MTRSTKFAHSRRNPKKASNDGPAHLPVIRVEQRGDRQTRRKRTEEQAAAVARHRHDIRTPAVIANRADANRRSVPPDE